MPGYQQPGAAGILKNKLGLTSAEELSRNEARFVAARIAEIRAGLGPAGKLDADHLKAIHRHLFQDVYEWAGRTRDEHVRLADKTVATEPIMQKVGGKPFAIGPAIPAQLDRLMAEVKAANHLRGLSRREFASQAADVMATLNAIHPFREGNGRTQREFMLKLAKAAGHELDFTVIAKERMVRTSVAANELGDPSMMRRMFVEISDPARTALLRAGIERLQESFDRMASASGRPAQQWNDLYVATLDPDHPTEITMAGVLSDQFMGRTDDAILFGHPADLPDPPPGRQETFVHHPAMRRQEIALANIREAIDQGHEPSRHDLARLTASQLEEIAQGSDADLQKMLTRGQPSPSPDDGWDP